MFITCQANRTQNDKQCTITTKFALKRKSGSDISKLNPAFSE